MRATLLLASLAACSHAFLLPGAPTPAASRVATAPGACTALHCSNLCWSLCRAWPALLAYWSKKQLTHKPNPR